MRIKILWVLARLAALLAVPVAMQAFAQDPPTPAPGTPQAAGRQIFLTRCASCHGTTGNGGEFAPGITTRVPLRTDDDLVQILHSGLPGSGMPAFPDVVATDRTNLIAFLRTLRAREGTEVTHATIDMENGTSLAGSVLNRSSSSLQLLDENKKLYLLRKTASGKYR